MTRFRVALACVVVFTLAIGGAMLVIGRTMVDPVEGRQSLYTALFNDASGLYQGNSVRLAGVAVGKVESVEVDGPLARVRFSVQDAHAPEQNSEFAIRYQNLVGQRYLEMIRKPEKADRQKSGVPIPTARTISAFDITDLFNGVAPLIGTFDPAELNKFAENVGLVLQGDGAGLAPALQSITKIAAFAGDRDQLITLIVDNVNKVAAQINGRSGQVAKLVTTLNASIVKFTSRITVVQESLDAGERVLVPFVDVLQTLVGALDNNRSALEGLANRLVPATPEIIEAIQSIPGLLEKFNKTLPPGPTPDLVCSRGRMDLPDTVQVLVGGKKVVACR